MYETWTPTGTPYWRTTAEGRRHAVTRVMRTSEGSLFGTMCGVVTITPSYPASQEPCQSCEAAFHEVALEL